MKLTTMTLIASLFAAPAFAYKGQDLGHFMPQRIDHVELVSMETALAEKAHVAELKQQIADATSALKALKAEYKVARVDAAQDMRVAKAIARTEKATAKKLAKDAKQAAADADAALMDTLTHGG